MLLAIDTSGEFCSVALVDNSGQLHSRTINERHQHASQLVSQIEQLLAAQDITHHQLSKLAVMTGPGSFTGLRIGIAAAKALALAANLAVYPITTTQALATYLASLYSGPPGLMLACHQAYPNQYYAQIFTHQAEPASAIMDGTAVAATKTDWAQLKLIGGSATEAFLRTAKDTIAPLETQIIASLPTSMAIWVAKSAMLNHIKAEKGRDLRPYYVQTNYTKAAKGA